ncbi:putative ankyrin repeat domain-containing protein 13D isoform X2 [Penaeus vannamei]|uniref:Putative ankyrin repeat domain-containing protein 13D isoform X2 n=1 Tax=Penaeus vannamei TaxID=6689 RepID=A0A3R7MMR5_PENVA|nr:putative ankyrin repeat domain-containing protein 13D isoform X2 [Penaeus vannamei]
MEEGGPAEGKDGSQNEDSGPESAEGTVENAQATACSANVQNSIDTKGREGREGYPLHWLVWHNDYRNLETELASGKHDKELKDFRGRTPLMLAVTLGHLEATRTLLKYNCNGNVENADGWTVVQEATATGDPEILKVVLEGRDVERYSSRVAGIPTLLEKLKEAPDFYVEMKWEFTSWVDGATMMEVDHETCQVYIENMRTLTTEQALATMRPHPAMVSHRLTTPIATTYIDTDKISFERDKAGIWGWRSDRTENVNGHDCKVFSATNVELVTKTRTEHLTDAEKEKSLPRSPLQSFLNIAEVEEKQNSPSSSEGSETYNFNNPTNITAEEYFNPNVDLQGRDIGRPKEVVKKVQNFKAHLWLAEEYPLKLQEQVMPIVDLMAITSTHFAKLKHFIQMQLPSGFPVKIEIPLFHVLTARITFGNIFGVDESVDKVSTVKEEDRVTCVIDETVFEPPPSYTKIGHSDQQHLQMSMDEDDALLQYAIQQSLVEAGTEQDQVDIWEALQAEHRPAPRVPGCNSRSGSTPNTPAHLSLQAVEDAQLQRAIEESLALSIGVTNIRSSQEDLSSSENAEVAVPRGLALTPGGSIVDSEMAMALSLSQQQQEEEEARKRQEEETLKRILELSLTEK